MTPVLLLSDNQVANGSEPWMLPDVNALAPIEVEFAKHPNGPNGTFLPYMRDIDTFARPWAVPGTLGLEHRIGGLEKEAITGNVSYDPANHQLMTDSRAWKVANIVNDIPDLEVPATRMPTSWCWGGDRPSDRYVPPPGEWLDHAGKVATLHLRHLNPMPQNLGDPAPL